MAITTPDQLIAALNSAQRLNFYKASMTAKAAGTFQSLWTAAGFPAAGAAPGSASGVAPTKATAGAWSFTNPPGGSHSYVVGAGASMATLGKLIVYDRLVHTSNLSGTVATAQTVNSATLTRNTDGVGVELWAEVYSATGATAANLTVSYTNSAGMEGRVSPVVGFQVSPVSGQMIPIPLASGDGGVRSVQSVTLSASTGTAGNFGITLLSRLAEVPVTVANTGVQFDWAALNMVRVPDDACLAFMVHCSATNTGAILGNLTLAQG